MVKPGTEEELLLSLLPPFVPALKGIPDDEVSDATVGPLIATQRALDRYPVESPVTPMDATLREAFTHAAQTRFKVTLDRLDHRVLAKLEQPFGKENLSQCFYSTPGLRHILLPLWKSGFLAGCREDWEAFSLAYYPVRILRDLLQEYGDVPFAGIRGYSEAWASGTDVDSRRVAMATAALLHFNGSVADLVRWIGGPHVGEHRDHQDIIRRLLKAGVDARVLHDIRRIFQSGIPAYCNAESNEQNFAAYYAYGNHSTMDVDPDKAHAAMAKDYRRGFTLLFDPRIVLLMLHCHLTPQGVVDLNTIFKNPRPIFDSSFRPYPWCFAINDWTSKDNEPPLTFATAELEFMIWMYNLRITYPWLEIYIADDDVSGAFRLMKYNPDLVGLHTSLQGDYCVVNTGGTFGDNTSPSNFDPIGLARRQLAWYLWKHETEAQLRAKAYLPLVQLAAPPTPVEIAAFCPADADTINTGVLDANGDRLAPPYNMHVDDALYADVAQFLPHTIYTSVAALFGVLGEPTNPLVPSPLSLDKFESWYDHERKLVGRKFNSRTLSVGLLPHKQEQLLTLLDEWSTKTHFDLLEIAHLLGVLENHTKYARWARCWYFSLQNSVRRALTTRYQIVHRRYKRQDREFVLLRQLPPHLSDRMFTIIAREKAHLLWSTRQRFVVDPYVMDSLSHLTYYLRDMDCPWEVPIGMIIPRDPHFFSRGDASHVGGGAYCPTLRFWFDIAWSPTTVAGILTRQSAPGAVHINALEFIVVILQLAAIRVRIDTMSHSGEAAMFPGGLPNIPVWLGETDNTVSKSWENRATARTSQGQGLVSIYAELLRTSRIHTLCQHLPGDLNIVADDISRNDFSLASVARCTKLFRTHPSLASWDFFLPSLELLQLLTSRLYSRHMRVPCVLPTVLGRFVPAGCITFGSATL